VFETGCAFMAERYQQLGARVLLPLERVWAGTRSTAAPWSSRAFGGFHHPSQGYRHVQMDATITLYGSLISDQPKSPQVTAVDLVRSYAHDCLHYASFRRYRLSDRGEVARVQYGINQREAGGRTYSAPDAPGDGPTRNLGILMEGASDAEATAIARQAAEKSGVTVERVDTSLNRLALAEATGVATVGMMTEMAEEGHAYARSMSQFNQAVTSRYHALLRELATDPAELHTQFVRAIVSGDRAQVEAWLDAHHGPRCFTRLFRAPAFGEPVR
jgi:hypothetical protein